MPTVAFDVYGTLINTDSLNSSLTLLIGSRARAFSKTWREKQLEYSFRRGLMQAYQDFDCCTRQALDYANLFHGTSLSHNQKDQLLKEYSRLPPFDDVIKCLEVLQRSGVKLVVFSNGKPESITELLHHAHLQRYMEAVISVDSLQTFKPDPRVYAHLIQEANAQLPETWLVSSNSFDIIGATHAGLRTAWVKRGSTAIFDPWDIAPTLTVSNLEEFAAHITRSATE